MTTIHDDLDATFGTRWRNPPSRMDEAMGAMAEELVPFVERWHIGADGKPDQHAVTVADGVTRRDHSEILHQLERVCWDARWLCGTLDKGFGDLEPHIVRATAEKIEKLMRELSL